MENEIALIEEETETKAEKKEREKLEKAEIDFVAGRIQGKTIQELSDKLWIQEETCLDWNTRHYSEIKNSKILKTEILMKKNKTSREDRIQTTSLMLAKINKEIAKRDFSDVPTDKLILLGTKLQEFLQNQLEENGSTFLKL